MTKKVLVLGGSGFIGRSIVKHLLNSDFFVTSADCKDSKDLLDIKKSSKGKMLEIIKADFSELSSFKSLSHSYDEIYMLAAIVGVNRTLKNPSEVIRILVWRNGGNPIQSSLPDFRICMQPLDIVLHFSKETSYLTHL